MSDDIFSLLRELKTKRCILLTDQASGLRAILVLDGLTLGPAAGGIRTRQYPSTEAAIEDANNLARAMTVKCALAGIDAGGGKAVVAAETWPEREFDIFCPCAIGGVVSPQLAQNLKAWAVCGAANNVIAEPQAEQILIDRGILFVPDVIASAGAVIEGGGKSIMGLDDCSPLINRIGVTTGAILDTAFRGSMLPTMVAKEWAYERIAPAKEAKFSIMMAELCL